MIVSIELAFFVYWANAFIKHYRLLHFGFLRGAGESQILPILNEKWDKMLLGWPMGWLLILFPVGRR